MTKPISQEIITINQVQANFPLCCNRSISSSALGVLVSVSAILSTATVITCLSLACAPEILIIITALITGILVILCFLQIIFHIHDKKQKTIVHTSPPQPLLIRSPKLSRTILRELKQKMSTASGRATIENLIHVNQEDFFPDCGAWAEIFLKDPQFLLQSMLTSWEANQKDDYEVTLSRDYIGFDIVLTTRDFAQLEVEPVINEQRKRCYLHQVLQEDLPKAINSQVIRTKLGNTTYTLPVLQDLLTPDENTDEILYKIFRSFFIKYYVALNASVSREKIITLQLLRSGCLDIRVRQMEILALFCAIEQMRYTKTPEVPNSHKLVTKRESQITKPVAATYQSPYNQLRTSVPTNHPPAPTEANPTFQSDEIQSFLVEKRLQQDIPTNASQTSVYILSPKDYWKIFVEKNMVSFPRECSPYGLISHPRDDPEDSIRNLNRARFMETENIVIANLTEMEIESLSYLSKKIAPE
ncbi:hypothetical protein O1W69_03445 [Chlamydia sp. 12-01]|uniref:hypothetical protein n=1 Tax=Chlamydia sp. 12-01 TaxID=3002742 RepID=UPI0035D4F536